MSAALDLTLGFAQPHGIVLIALIFLVAFIYSSVGHGGASGYLAVLSFFAVPKAEMATSALCLNLLVSGLAAYSFYKAGYFSWKLTWPFVWGSIPAALLGGLIKVSPVVYDRLLAFALVFAAIRLAFDFEHKTQFVYNPPSRIVALPVGGCIGLLSGIVGVGGGIFLSPVMILLKWADPKTVAATSAFFIFVNSASGLLGRGLRGSFQITPSILFLLFTALAGGFAGSKMGARYFSALWLKRVLALVLGVAVVKLFVHS